MSGKMVTIRGQTNQDLSPNQIRYHKLKEEMVFRHQILPQQIVIMTRNRLSSLKRAHPL